MLVSYGQPLETDCCSQGQLSSIDGSGPIPAVQQENSQNCWQERTCLTSNQCAAGALGSCTAVAASERIGEARLSSSDALLMFHASNLLLCTVHLSAAPFILQL